MLMIVILVSFRVLVVLMFFRFFAVFVVMFVFIFGLHAFHDFFFLDAVTQRFHQVHLHSACLRRGAQGLLDPFVRFSTYVHHHVGACDSCDILCRRLVAVQVGAVLDEQLQVHRIQAASKNVLQPVVLWIGRCDNGNFLLCGSLFVRFCTAGDKCQGRRQNKHCKCCNFLHDKSFFLSGLKFELMFYDPWHLPCRGRPSIQ